MKRKSSYKLPKKSVGEQVMTDLIMVIIVSSLIYVICGFFKVLFWPLRYLFMSAERINHEDIMKAMKKVWKRRDYIERVREDPNDPMNEYLARFVKNPKSYANDPDNDEYLKWYLMWRDGKVLDSRLRWIPDVYVKENDENRLNLEFVNYLEIQYQLHTEANLIHKHCFLSTIRKYFPEVTPKMSVMETEIEELKDRAKAKLLKKELRDEIRKIGIPEEIADILSKQKLPGEELLAKAKVIKTGIEQGYTQASALFIAEKGYDPEGKTAVIANHLLSNGCPAYLLEEFLDKNISQDELLEILKFRTSIYELYGEEALKTDAYGVTNAEKAIREKLAEVKAQRKKQEIEEKAGKAAWQD